MLVSAKAINQSSEAYSFKESSLPWSVRGEVREVKKQGGKYAELSPEFGKQGGILALVEVRLIDTLNGSVYAPPPNKPVSFTIKGLKVLSNGKIALAHEKPDGTVEYFSAEAKNGDVEFSLSGSALYAFAQDIESFSRVNIESIINTSRARLKWLPVFCLAAVASIYATSVKMENWPLWSEKKRLAAAQPKKAFSTPKYVFKYMRK
ncbi:MAG: hypothetical protein LBC69_00185, partial [Eubacteriaceae bacterium]|jgi:hypothetical protein|nr:hypothetical protein [Eubacteriaceae bacterium]